MQLPDIPAVETAIVEMTNAFRAKNTLAEVRPEPRLAAAARAYAAYLAKSGQFSHSADGREAGDRIASAGYTWCTVAENLALHLDSRGFESRDLAKKSVEGWINSPSHRENMLTPYVTDIGVGVVQAPGKDPKYISVQLFARPRAMEYAFQISNTSKSSVAYAFGGERHEISPHMSVTHTACTPDALAFERIGTPAVTARYDAIDGMVYTIKGDTARGLTIEAGQREALGP